MAFENSKSSPACAAAALMPRAHNHSGLLGEGAKACLTPGSRATTSSSRTNFHKKNLEKIAQIAGASQKRRASTADSTDRSHARSSSASTFKSTRPREPLYPFDGFSAVPMTPESPQRDSDVSNASTLGATPDEEDRLYVTQGIQRLVLDDSSCSTASKPSARLAATPAASAAHRPAFSRLASSRRTADRGDRNSAPKPKTAQAARPDYSSRGLFTASFSATGVPFTSMRSPRLSRAADRPANATAIEKRATAPRPRSATTPSVHSPGQVPGYLARRKAGRAAAAKRAEERSSALPAGMRILPDQERAALQAELQREWQVAMGAFQRLPVAPPRPEQRLRRNALESHLDTLDALGQRLRAPGVLLVPDGGALSVPRWDSASGAPPMSEVERVKAMQRGPSIF